MCKEGGGEGWFQTEIGWRLGCGDKAKFWEDVWVGNTNLKTVFPRLFSISNNQEHKVAEVGMWEGSCSVRLTGTSSCVASTVS